MASSSISVGAQIPSVTKSITQDSIDQFENCGILDRENIHNSPDLAQRRLGTAYTLASGRMSVAFASESLRRFFGPEVFNHSGVVNLKFLRPVKGGDTITVHGSVVHQEETTEGTLVSVDIYCENQDRNRTAIGMGTAVVPKG